MTQQHPITPPPELVQQWISQFWNDGKPSLLGESDMDLSIRAAQWGADQELEAVLDFCKKWLTPWEVDNLRAIRRPKPPNLKEQALDALKMHFAAIGENQCYQPAHEQIIRRALEQLPDD
jgi:hypothetical protein